MLAGTRKSHGLAILNGQTIWLTGRLVIDSCAGLQLDIAEHAAHCLNKTGVDIDIPE